MVHTSILQLFNQSINQSINPICYRFPPRSLGSGVLVCFVYRPERHLLFWMDGWLGHLWVCHCTEQRVPAHTVLIYILYYIHCICFNQSMYYCTMNHMQVWFDGVITYLHAIHMYMLYICEYSIPPCQYICTYVYIHVYVWALHGLDGSGTGCVFGCMK